VQKDMNVSMQREFPQNVELNDDVRVIWLKLPIDCTTCKLWNLWNYKQTKIASRLYISMPLAHRLGLYNKK
jgi:hypothetical protein